MALFLSEAPLALQGEMMGLGQRVGCSVVTVLSDFCALSPDIC